MKVGAALAEWRKAHARDDGRGRRVFWLTVGPLRVPLPHPGQLHWHDLHHVALGYGSDLIGEMEVSAFELRTGPANAVVLFLCVSAVLLGALVAPRRTLEAFRSARGARNLYRCPIPNEQLLDWPIDALRGWMRLTAAGPPAPARSLT